MRAVQVEILKVENEMVPEVLDAGRKSLWRRDRPPGVSLGSVALSLGQTGEELSSMPFLSKES